MPMRVDINVSQQGPRFLLSDLPDDDEWVEITQYQDTTQTFLGVNTGDVLGIREIGGLPLPYRKYAKHDRGNIAEEVEVKCHARHES